MLGEEPGSSRSSDGGLLCSCLRHQAQRPPPRSQETAFGFRADRDLHHPLAHPEHHHPPTAPPQILPGIRKQQGEPGICGGCRVRGRLSPPLSLHASRGRWCHPGTQQKRGPRVVLAVEEVGVLAPKQPVQEWRWPACSPAGFTVPHPALPGGCSVTIIWPQGQVTPKPASSLCLS